MIGVLSTRIFLRYFPESLENGMNMLMIPRAMKM